MHWPDMYIYRGPTFPSCRGQSSRKSSTFFRPTVNEQGQLDEGEKCQKAMKRRGKKRRKKEKRRTIIPERLSKVQPASSYFSTCGRPLVVMNSWAKERTFCQFMWAQATGAAAALAATFAIFKLIRLPRELLLVSLGSNRCSRISF